MSFNRGPINPPGTPKPGTPEFEAAAKQVEEEMRQSGARGGGILQELLESSKRPPIPPHWAKAAEDASKQPTPTSSDVLRQFKGSREQIARMQNGSDDGS